MEKIKKKDLMREYRERKPAQGVFAVRCGAQVWVASSRNLDAQKNQIWFGLRTGGHPNKTMQAAWKEHGEAVFEYEVLEQVTDENPLLVDSLVKDREAHWRQKLGAESVVS
jgi:hypothetical protein